MFKNSKRNETDWLIYQHLQRETRKLFRSFYGGVDNKSGSSINGSTNLREGGSNMGHDCKKIDWTKPMRGVSSPDHDYTHKHSALSNGRRLIKWDAPSWGPSEVIVDAQGHILWHSHSERYIGEHFCENVPEEKKEYIMLYKNSPREDWRINYNAYRYLDTKSYWERAAESHKKYYRDGDAIVVRACELMLKN